MKIHIINQYVWPDGSPVCLYNEQLAIELKKNGLNVVLVGGLGVYRKSSRVKPNCKIVNITTKALPRDKVLQILIEYFSVYKKMWNYTRDKVKNNDIVIATSSPFLNVFLLFALKNKNKIRKFFLLTDYFPESIVSVYRVLNPILNILSKIFNFFLKKWDLVIKVSSNLSYFGKNSVLYRFWPTLQIKPFKTKAKKMVLYTGNLGITHDVEALIYECDKWRKKGYKIHFYADGPGIKKLPNWIESFGTFKKQDDLIKALEEHEIHLVAGTLKTEGSSFPSKIWNSLASGRKIIPCGFYGSMKKEFKEVIKSDYKKHLTNLVNFIKKEINFNN